MLHRPGTVALVLLGLLSLSCNRGAASARADAASAEAPKHWGELMPEVGHRFERAGRAVLAGRWELASYDLHELDEVLDDDLPHAQQPEDIHVDLLPMARDLAARGVAAMQRAAQARDRAAFEAAFAQSAALCANCHHAANRAFIEVPTTLGAPVPTLEASAPAPTAPPTAPAGAAAPHSP
jgi:hypothetical protein